MDTGELAVDPTNLSRGITEAIATGDFERAVAIGEMLAATGQRTAQTDAQVATAFGSLIDQATPHAIDDAERWAATWSRQHKTSKARERAKGLSLRLRELITLHGHLEQALEQRNRAAVLAVCQRIRQTPDRLTTTAALLERAEALLTASAQQVNILQQQRDASLPHALDKATEAQRSMTAITGSETDRTALAALEQRLSAVRHAESQLAAAIDGGRPGRIDQALQPFAGQADKTDASDALISRAIGERDRRQSQATAARQRLTHAQERDLTTAIVALDALLRADPEAPEADMRSGLVRRHAQLTKLHDTLGSACTA